MLSLLTLPLLFGCGTSSGTTDLRIKPGYTSNGVIQAFEQRMAYKQPTDLKPFPIMIEGRETPFASLDQAIKAAADGDTIVLGDGVYRGSAVLEYKTVNLKGQGRGKTHLVAKETALLVRESIVKVSGISFWSTSVGPDVAVAAVTKSTLFVEDCRFSGGTGPGMLVAGTLALVELLNNHFIGNMGGGLRIQGGAVTSRRNVYTRNAVAGIILAPAREKAIARLRIWHDTILNNWGGRRCISLLRAGVVRMEQQGPYEIESTILNSTGIGQTFSENEFVRIKREGRNFLSDKPLPANPFFVNDAAFDFRPLAPLVKDSLGIELGAYPSRTGSDELVGLVGSAFSTEKLQLAYNYALFLPIDERHNMHQKIQEKAYSWLNDYLQKGVVGTRLLGILGLSIVAPAEWKLDVILARFMEGFKERYSFQLKPLHFFPNSPAMADEIESMMERYKNQFPRFITEDTDNEKAFILSGTVVTKPMVTSEVREFKILQKIDNPRHAKIIETRKLLENRRKEKAKRVEDLEFTLNNPHVHMKKGSRYYMGLETKLATQKQQLADLVEQLRLLDEEFKASVPQFEITVQGNLRKTTVTGEFSSQLVAAPAGEILLDTAEEISYSTTTLSVKPIPEFNYPGTDEATTVPDPLRLMGIAVANRILAAVIKKDARSLESLMTRYASGVITSAEEDRLVELLLLNARLFEKAKEAHLEYEELLQNPGSGEPIVILQHDDTVGLGKEGVRVMVHYSSPEQTSARSAELADLYEPFWNMLPDVQKYLKVRFGLTEEMFYANRLQMED